jgi:hypothetical protein
MDDTVGSFIFGAVLGSFVVFCIYDGWEDTTDQVKRRTAWADQVCAPHGGSRSFDISYDNDIDVTCQSGLEIVGKIPRE